MISKFLNSSLQVEWKMLTRTSSSSLIQQSPEPTVQASSGSSLCSECLTTLALGITHNCSPSTAVLNMIFLAISLGSLEAEQVAAGLLKNKMDKENIQKGEVFLLSTLLQVETNFRFKLVALITNLKENL